MQPQGERRKESLTEADVEHILVLVDQRLSTYSWKIIMWLGIPFILLCVAWGAMSLQVQKNTIAIETSVLTVKDKDNLEIKISNLSDKLDANNQAILSAILELKGDIRRLH